MDALDRIETIHQITSPVNGNAAQVLDDCHALAAMPAGYVEANVLPRYVPAAEVNEAEHRRKIGLLILWRLNVADKKVRQ